MTALKTLLFTVIAPGTVTLLIPAWLITAGRASADLPIGRLRGLGAVGIALGALIYSRCAWDFTFVGHGTPAPIDPPKHLVVQGLYRHVRNPMYVGIVTVLLGEAVLFASRLLFGYAAAVFLIFCSLVLLYEEPALRRRFGANYRRYCEAVPRWIPRFRPWSSPT